ncbi:MAG: LspG (Type II protein secretion LspG pseudopilin) [Candidatus Gottesmanbacteria bacterium GW2011_GWB1_43_11]|uniref:LspG (Type II protein secretion LspG pseudopilin) n=1 Tax=Candidatus Gottesmanbacteria bacterium GW2011_GWB1_43_11 TaxID=1618446 RepID=A0A0G1FC29_9BACT|nr:MAG: LspG (Type II protein secretion LspG pseudopilin) [Candidatus Gottesmanbacteria bacterium GW2011_GWB1_43_11]
MQKSLSLSVWGFTLIEIMIVIGILGILATAGYASFLGSQKNARDSRRKVDLETIRQALELYRLDNGQYPFDDPFTTSCDSSLGFVVSNALGCAAATGGDWSASLKNFF